MLDSYSGATHVHFIVGDPIAQVKSPYGMTEAFEQRGVDAICVPAHVSSAQLTAWFEGVRLSKNVDGIMVTVPHKFDFQALCDTCSPRAQFLQAVNTVRRLPDGRWHGDMFDGLGYVQAIQEKGCQLQGKKALLVGTGGAGSAIAHALVMAGVQVLALHDADTHRLERLRAGLSSLGKADIRVGRTDPRGYDIVLNATPMGMRAGDPLPVQVEHLDPSMLVGCVVTVPAVPPLIEAARALGCMTTTGADMFAKVRTLMVDFLLGKEVA